MNLMVKEREVSEIVFMIYVPRGTGLEAKNVRKSTWLNPLVDGEEARKMIGKYFDLSSIDTQVL